ncbi:MAG: 3-hydroxyacyl-CoA dehydrogenase family protein [Pedobacter sp.]|uniref:3-hydroxyacyl-CoA dehydrogenase family protein n=1 Tax=Pedobacter sp. TaxID=1411316 RepID=UPI003563CFF2
MKNQGVEMPVLVVGSGKVAQGVVNCLSSAGHPIDYYNIDNGKDMLPDHIPEKLVVMVTSEDKIEKISWIVLLQQRMDSDATIAVNMESILLDELQEKAQQPEQIIGLNWVYPADQTFFLEIISNAVCNERNIALLQHLGKNCWGKDPYTVCSGFSARARMFAAMVREAFYLVEKEYASIESVDRACRNDAGYYLPFAGNFRYMDLMGTYAYGAVMKDLNPELCNEKTPAIFFKELLKNGGLGIENNTGFYNYTESGVQEWNGLFNQFSEDIRKIMLKYPFGKEQEI